MFLAISQNSQENTFASGVFLWILQNFSEDLFYRTPLSDCFCLPETKCIRSILDITLWVHVQNERLQQSLNVEKTIVDIICKKMNAVVSSCLPSNQFKSSENCIRRRLHGEAPKRQTSESMVQTTKSWYWLANSHCEQNRDTWKKSRHEECFKDFWSIKNKSSK